MISLYRYSLDEAKEYGEAEKWRESHKENIRCRNYLDEQVRQCYKDNILSPEGVENTVKEFGYDRTIVGGKRFAYSLLRTLSQYVKATEDFTVRIPIGQRNSRSPKATAITNSR